MTDTLIEQLNQILGNEAVKLNEPMSQHTTLRVGGPADIFVTVESSKALIGCITLAYAHKVPFFILGLGSNILVGDKGIRGLVIKNKTASFTKLEGTAPKPKQSAKARLVQRKEDKMFWYDDLVYDESGYPRTLVQIDTGYPLPKLISDLIEAGITGLEWFGGIPGTLGGAIYNNIHGADRFMGDYLVSADLITSDNVSKTVGPDYFDFDYDYSKLHQTHDAIIRVVLSLPMGDKQKARKILGEWIKRKASWHPNRSSGCVFQNLPYDVQRAHNFPTNSVGYVIDQQLMLKGKKIGGAQVSNKHANFIVNRDNATASDMVRLIRFIKQKAQKKLVITLKEEIFYVGEF